MPGAALADLEYVLDEAFVPALLAHDPGLVIVSAGQDMLADDPKGSLCLRPGDYGTLTRLLIDALGLPLALVLEGGYGPSQQQAVGAILEALTGVPFARGERRAAPVHARGRGNPPAPHWLRGGPEGLSGRAPYDSAWTPERLPSACAPATPGPGRSGP